MIDCGIAMVERRPKSCSSEGRQKEGKLVMST